jgi:L-lactate permease
MSGEDFGYTCVDAADMACAETCVSLEACEACDCAVVQVDGTGPWGNFMDVFFCLLPIIFLIWATLKKKPLPTTTSLPAAAFFMYLVRLMYLKSDPLLANAGVILGLHAALTPLSIMAGAITLFETMEATYCMPYMMREIKGLTAGHPIAELML